MVFDMLRKMIDEGAEKQARAEEKDKIRNEFREMDRRIVAKMDDTDLAVWQSTYPKESPQFIFADQLWKYRLARRSAKFAALIAVLSALVGALGGYFLRGPVAIANDCASDKPKQHVPPPVANEQKSNRDMSREDKK